MRKKLFSGVLVLSMSFTEVNAQDTYSKGESAKEMFENSQAPVSISYGGGIKVETRNVTPEVKCDKVSDLGPDGRAVTVPAPAPSYHCDYIGPLLLG